jgi:hypothetical protein
MKRLSVYLLILIVSVLYSCSNDNENSVNSDLINVSSSGSGTARKDLPIIQFEETVHDFGKITQGERVKYSFQFKNTGKSNLVVSNVSTTCGCTIADKPKDPIPPGGNGKIEVEFNSEGKKNIVERTITVVTNCEPNATSLTIKAEVIEPVSLYSNETN